MRIERGILVGVLVVELNGILHGADGLVQQPTLLKGSAKIHVDELVLRIQLQRFLELEDGLAILRRAELH